MDKIKPNQTIDISKLTSYDIGRPLKYIEGYMPEWQGTLIAWDEDCIHIGSYKSNNIDGDRHSPDYFVFADQIEPDPNCKYCSGTGRAVPIFRPDTPDGKRVCFCTHSKTKG